MAVWRVTVKGELYGVETWENVFHIDPSGAFSSIPVLDAFEAAYNTAAAGGGVAWLTPCPGNLTTKIGVHMSSISLQQVVSPGIPLVRPVSHNGGQNTNGGLPVDTSVVISWQTDRAGRSYRGRTYLPPWHENKNDDSTTAFPAPDAATLLGITVNAAKLIDDLATANAPLCVYSRKLASAELISGGYVDNSWDTQRRRGKSLPAVKTAF